MINFHLIDCIEFMKTKPDDCYDLAIVDPPYGIGADKQKASSSPRKNGNRRRLKWDANWDTIPEPEYFTEVQRVSKNQIIWGGNYFIDYLSNTRCLVVWDKVQNFTGADFEIAWTSFESSSKIFRYARCLIHHYPDGEPRIHPTQKPVQLYRWLLQNYAEPGQSILDTHGGSMSSAIACDMEGFDLDICEIDKDYFDAGVKRFNQYKSQLKLF